MTLEQGGIQRREMIGVPIANREVRRVPLNWQHPLDERGFPVPLYEFSSFSEDLVAKYNEDSPAGKIYTREEILGFHMPDFSEIPADEMGICAYEKTTEGTPISPIFPNTPEGRFLLVKHCAEHETAFADFTADTSEWAQLLFSVNLASVDLSTGRLEIQNTLSS
jgi:hypothetical protein